MLDSSKYLLQYGINTTVRGKFGRSGRSTQKSKRARASVHLWLLPLPPLFFYFLWRGGNLAEFERGYFVSVGTGMQRNMEEDRR